MNRYRWLVLIFLLAWNLCHASNIPPESPTKTIVSFEESNPFEEGTLVSEPALGGKALRIDKSYVDMRGPQDWSGYDYLKMELYSKTQEHFNINFEISDAESKGYWTRVNYSTIASPGKSTLVIPVKELYVGEKSRPGRMLNLNAITKIVIDIGDNPKAPVFIGKIWLDKDNPADNSQFDGLRAFDFGKETSPLMEGFTRVSPSTLYNKELGYGLRNAKVWRAVDALQPDPLYQDYLCIESGGFAVDVPNGTYRVFVNIDNPSGYWGEFQFYRQRSILAQGKEVVHDTMDFNALKDKYFRYWNTEDLPTDNTFDKYEKPYFHEKTFDVNVTDGQLKIDFQGENFACSVSTIIVYPVSKASEGERFLKWVENKRRFHFDNYFKRSLHTPTGDQLNPSESEQKQGYILFQRDIMKDVYTNDAPFKAEIGQQLTADSFADQRESITLSLLPLRDLGMVSIQVSELKGPAGTIPSSAIETGYVSNRISRVTGDGTI